MIGVSAWPAYSSTKLRKAKFKRCYLSRTGQERVFVPVADNMTYLGLLIDIDPIRPTGDRHEREKQRNLFSFSPYLSDVLTVSTNQKLDICLRKPALNS